MSITNLILCVFSLESSVHLVCGTLVRSAMDTHPCVCLSVCLSICEHNYLSGSFQRSVSSLLLSSLCHLCQSVHPSCVVHHSISLAVCHPFRSQRNSLFVRSSCLRLASHFSRVQWLLIHVWMSVLSVCLSVELSRLFSKVKSLEHHCPPSGFCPSVRFRPASCLLSLSTKCPSAVSVCLSTGRLSHCMVDFKSQVSFSVSLASPDLKPFSTFCSNCSDLLHTTQFLLHAWISVLPSPVCPSENSIVSLVDVRVHTRWINCSCEIAE